MRPARDPHCCVGVQPHERAWCVERDYGRAGRPAEFWLPIAYYPFTDTGLDEAIATKFEADDNGCTTRVRVDEAH